MKNYSVFLKPTDVAEIISVSIPTAYRIIRLLNEELQEKGFVIKSGRINRKYFEERYGISLSEMPDDTSKNDKGVTEDVSA